MEPKKKPGHDTTSPCDGFYDKEAEEAVIGAIILESQAIYEVADMLTPDMFGSPQCANLYAAALALYDRSERIDMITILEETRKNGLPYEEYAVFVTTILTAVASAANIVTHALYIKEAHARRLFTTHLHGLLAQAALSREAGARRNNPAQAFGARGL